jgi:hypothetical protein
MLGASSQRASWIPLTVRAIEDLDACGSVEHDALGHVRYRRQLVFR